MLKAFEFILKCVVLTYFIDMYLFFFHVAYHSARTPLWIRNIHRRHHDEFLRTRVFSLHPLEFIVEAIPGSVVSYYFIGAWFIPIFLFWALFEAARGHGHFLWFKIPKVYYRFFKFCGAKYHLYHHETDETKNLGQMLKVWDKLLGTSWEVSK